MELERSLDRFREQGLGVAALSYDSAELLAHASERFGIRYPLLSDPDSEVIRTFGILNANIPTDHHWYGIPFPGTFLVDAEGRVTAKYFEELHRQRVTADSILVRELAAGGGTRTEVTTDQLRLLAYPAQDVARRGNRLTLVLEIELPEKMHLYAPGVEGYTPVSFEIDESPSLWVHAPELPEAELLHLPAIDETVPVYEGTLRIARDVTISPRLRDERLEITGRFAYQACDDKVCYRPTTLPLRFALTLEPHDGERAPEEMRRKVGGGG